MLGGRNSNGNGNRVKIVTCSFSPPNRPSKIIVTRAKNNDINKCIKDTTMNGTKDTTIKGHKDTTMKGMKDTTMIKDTTMRYTTECLKDNTK